MEAIPIPSIIDVISLRPVPENNLAAFEKSFNEGLNRWGNFCCGEIECPPELSSSPGSELSSQSNPDWFFDQTKARRDCVSLIQSCFTEQQKNPESKKALRLDLSGKGVTSLPEELRSLVCLRELNLSDNPIHELPDWIPELPLLETLIIKNNNLSKLPHSISKAVSLESIDLSCNQFKTFPIEVAYLYNLRDLDLSFNQIETVCAQIGNLNLLQNLALEHNRITGLPETLCDLHRLRTLNVANNPLSSLPTRFYELSNLTRFIGNNTQLSQLPGHASCYQRMQSLTLVDSPLGHKMAAESFWPNVRSKPSAAKLLLEKAIELSA